MSCNVQHVQHSAMQVGSTTGFRVILGMPPVPVPAMGLQHLAAVARRTRLKQAKPASFKSAARSIGVVDLILLQGQAAGPCMRTRTLGQDGLPWRCKGQ